LTLTLISILRGAGSEAGLGNTTRAALRGVVRVTDCDCFGELLGIDFHSCETLDHKSKTDWWL
jgi:hypothetical protein